MNDRIASYFTLGLTSLGGWGLVVFGSYLAYRGDPASDAMLFVGAGLGIVGIGGKIERGKE